MSDRLDLSEDARTLLLLHFAGRPLSMRRSRPQSLPGRSVEETRDACRELAADGLMEPVSTFGGGLEALHRLTEEADQLSGMRHPISRRKSISAPDIRSPRVKTGRKVGVSRGSQRINREAKP